MTLTILLAAAIAWAALAYMARVEERARRV